ncbi:MAG: hypothetical protein V4649_11930 [Bacteroidota bacterium]
MKRLLAYAGIVIGLCILVAATSSQITGDVHKLRAPGKEKEWWREHYSAWGDLTAMAYLDNIVKFREARSFTYGQPAGTCKNNLDLYLYGDSYVTDIPPHVYSYVDSFHFIFRYQQQQCRLDTGKRNVLIIEVSERFLRAKFSDTSLYENIQVTQPIAGGILTESTAENEQHYASLLPSFKIADLFNPYINQNLEYHLFNYEFLTAPRLMKAGLNYRLFNRASGDVAISDDGQYLFLKRTVTPGHIYSCYGSISAGEINKIVASLNTIYKHYRDAGFDEVYLSIIPVPATILQPANYNRQIPAVQNHPALQMPVLDLYTVYKNHSSPQELYRAGDTHWNNNGMHEWLNLVNSTLRTENSKIDRR